MNIYLEKLLKNTILNDKDRYEIRQIFDVMDEKKKLNILANFDTILSAIAQIKIELRDQQEILLWKAVSNIEKALLQARTNGIKSATSSSIQHLKYKI